MLHFHTAKILVVNNFHYLAASVIDFIIYVDQL